MTDPDEDLNLLMPSPLCSTLPKQHISCSPLTAVLPPCVFVRACVHALQVDIQSLPNLIFGNKSLTKPDPPFHLDYPGSSASASPVLVRQACAACIFFLWVLEIELRPSCLQGKALYPELPPPHNSKTHVLHHIFWRDHIEVTPLIKS